MDQTSLFPLACPRCRQLLDELKPGLLRCSADQLSFRRVDGIWQMLLPERARHYEQFICEYERVRNAEGRGSNSPDYYQALPYQDLNGSFRADWTIRAASFDAFLRGVAAPMEQRAAGPLAIADLGSGNGWLANRLVLRGHSLAAVDLLLNDQDGLGCYRHYESIFMPVQAEFNSLPFSSQSLDLVVFNASFHYSTGYETTLAEALRVVRRSGCIVLLDSPIYHDVRSGQQMVRERETQYQERFGFASNSLSSENFLTYARLESLTQGFGLAMRIITPHYGPGWQWRRLKARLLGGREAANFHLVILSRPGSSV